MCAPLCLGVRRAARRPDRLRLLERRVAKAAAVVLGTSSDLVHRARSGGARDARLAAVAFPAPRTPVELVGGGGPPGPRPAPQPP
ncbi:hypothetical protein AB0D27_43015, partial [Streptomyces sp. NPDC048415]